MPARSTQFHCQQPSQLVHSGAEFFAECDQFCGKSVACFFRARQMSHRFFHIIHSPWSENHLWPIRSRDFNHWRHYTQIFFFHCLSGFSFLCRGATSTLSSSTSSLGVSGITSGSSSVATWVRLQISVVSPPGLGGRSLSSLQTYSGLGLDFKSRIYGHRPLSGPEDTSKESHF